MKTERLQGFTQIHYWDRKWAFPFQSAAILIHLLFFLNDTFPGSTLLFMSITFLKKPVKSQFKEINIAGFFLLLAEAYRAFS